LTNDAPLLVAQCVSASISLGAFIVAMNAPDARHVATHL
jgi:hypothetical protein